VVPKSANGFKMATAALRAWQSIGRATTTTYEADWQATARRRLPGWALSEGTSLTTEERLSIPQEPCRLLL